MDYYYHIQVKNSDGDWNYIAGFDNPTDRDECTGFLQDRYKDCEFRKVDDE
jgi:hypothetical protein